jgi:hypothetical protein
MKIRKIRKLVETLKAMPAELYEQRTWMKDSPCGTRACIAGHAALMEGYGSQKSRLVVSQDADGWSYDRYRSINELAREILGLSERTAERLFSGSCLGWRHENETWKCDTKAKQVACAIRELEDLIRLGPYDKRVRKPQPELVARRQRRLRINRKKRALLRPVQQNVQRLGTETDI